MMQETLLTGTARKAELPGWQAAGKTGTSQDWRDAWFVGYTSYLVAGVWLGNDDNSPTKKVSGGNLPVEIWSRFMKAAHRGRAAVAGCRRRLAQRRRAGRRRRRRRRRRRPSARRWRSAEAARPRRRSGARSAPVAADAPAPPVPPAPIPNVGADARAAPAARDKNLLDKLFGAM